MVEIIQQQQIQNEKEKKKPYETCNENKMKFT